MQDTRSIVCVHLNQLGDLLFSLPALHNLRRRFPEARIAGVVRPGLRGLLRSTGLVDEVIDRPRGLRANLRVARRLRREGFDLLLLFSTSFSTWAVSGLSGARLKVGFTHAMRGLMLDRRVEWSPPPSTRNNLRLVEAVGCKLVKRDYVGLVRPGREHQEVADALLREIGLGPEDGFAALAPGSSTGREIKCWSDEGFARVADGIRRDLGLKSVVVGLGGGERVCALSSNIVDLTGRTSLPVLAAVLRRARLLVGNDSGVMHLAAAVGAPVVALFGPTDPEVSGPQGEGHAIVEVDFDCRPCLRSECRLGRQCMECITPEMVLAAVRRVVA